MRLIALLLLVAAPAFGQPSAVVEMIPYPEGISAPRGQVSYAPPGSGFESRAVSFGGAERTYYAHDGSATGETAKAAILLLHGSQRDGRSMIDMWREVADAEGIVLVAPDSAGEGWDPAVDPPNLFVAVLNDVLETHPFDLRRVFMFGHSSGAILAQLYANRVPGPWQAVAAHAGTLDPRMIQESIQPIPILHMLGAQDPLFPDIAAESSAKALSNAGHEMTLRLIEGHDHWYYTIGPAISRMAWDFFDGRPQ